MQQHNIASTNADRAQSCLFPSHPSELLSAHSISLYSDAPRESPFLAKDDIFKQSLFGIKLGVCFSCNYFICHHCAFSCQKNILAFLKLGIFLAACRMCACAVWLFVGSASTKRVVLWCPLSSGDQLMKQ